MITIKEYLMGRETRWPPTQEMLDHAQETCYRLSYVLGMFGEQRHIVSGYRPPAINEITANASTTSKHLTCQAGDLEDKNGELKQWCLTNLDILAEIGLWMEDPLSTPTWVHLQTLAPASGSRVFKP